MKNEKSERKFDFRPMGLAIKKAREKKGMTQEQLADIIGRDTRTVMYHENDGVELQYILDNGIKRYEEQGLMC